MLTATNIPGEPTLAPKTYGGGNENEMIANPVTKEQLAVSFVDRKTGTEFNTSVVVEKRAACFYDSNNINWES